MHCMPHVRISTYLLDASYLTNTFLKVRKFNEHPRVSKIVYCKSSAIKALGFCEGNLFPYIRDFISEDDDDGYEKVIQNNNSRCS